VKDGIMFLFKEEDINKTKNIFIRHDVDHDPFLALEMAKIEAELGICSTYYFLTTDTFFAKKLWKKKRKEYLEAVKQIQDLGHEVGLHYDFFGDYYSKGKQPKENLQEIMTAFANAGIKMYGCASHGSSRVRKLISAKGLSDYPRQFVNYSVWKEVCRDEGKYKLKNRELTIPCVSLFENGLKYEAYFVRRNHYESDAGGTIWLLGDPLETAKNMKKGEIFSILVHPIWWKDYLK
jgi:predicted peroxiredoxin